jgi:hypothetical protein
MTDDDLNDLRGRLENAEMLIFDALTTLSEVGNEDAPLDSEANRARHHAALEQLRLGQEHLEQLGELLREQHHSRMTRH